MPDKQSPSCTAHKEGCSTMNNILLSIYPVMFVLVVLFNSHPRRKNAGTEDFLNIRQTRSVQSAACIGIILHHLSQQVTNYGSLDKGLITVFSYAGILFTALFFFFSGYGLMISLQNRTDYLHTFLQRRLPTVLIPFWLCNAVILIVNRLFYGIRYSFDQAVLYIPGINLINGNGWFIIEIVIIYIMFFALFSMFRNRDIALVLLTVAVFGLIACGFFSGHDPNNRRWFKGEWWYNSTIAFALGLWYARFKNKLDRFFSIHYRTMSVLFFLLFIVLFRFSVYCVRRFGYYYDLSISVGRRYASITLISQSAACIAFVICIILLLMKMVIGNRILESLNKIRLPLFLLHGYFVSTVFGNIKMNAFLKFGAVIICSVLAASVVSPLSAYLVRKSAIAFTSGQKTRGTLEWDNYIRTRKKLNRIIKKIVVLCVLLLLCLLLFQVIDNTVISKKHYLEECGDLKSAAVGDRVLWGRFETDPGHFGKERLHWIVIDKGEDYISLLSEKGISGGVYHHKHQDISWENCDLRKYLNSDVFTGMFSKYEAADVIPQNNDMLSLLTVEEAESVFASDKERELAITEKAKQDGTNINVMSYHNYWGMKGYSSSWWWLRGENGRSDIYAPIVTVDGTILEKTKAVNKPNGAIRPVIRVKYSNE